MAAAEAFSAEKTTELFQQKVADYTEDPQMRTIIECIAALYQNGEISSAIAIQLMTDLDVDYRAFHSPEAPPEESERWRAHKSVQLLFAKSIETDEAFRIRALMYLRDNVAWLGPFAAATGIFG
jgi:hypothetical protein